MQLLHAGAEPCLRSAAGAMPIRLRSGQAARGLSRTVSSAVLRLPRRPVADADDASGPDPVFLTAASGRGSPGGSACRSGSTSAAVPGEGIPCAPADRMRVPHPDEPAPRTGSARLSPGSGALATGRLPGDLPGPVTRQFPLPKKLL